MTSEQLTALIAKEKKTLDGLKAKKVDLEDKIRKSEAKLQQYEMMADSQKFAALSDVVKKSGISVEDVLAALQNGDLLALQEQMEASRAAQEASVMEQSNEATDD